jgi:hypothetical protein
MHSYMQRHVNYYYVLTYTCADCIAGFCFVFLLVSTCKSREYQNYAVDRKKTTMTMTKRTRTTKKEKYYQERSSLVFMCNACVRLYFSPFLVDVLLLLLLFLLVVFLVFYRQYCRSFGRRKTNKNKRTMK